MYNGIIVINKESGMSSHDVVYKLRKMTGQKKIGHMGTLDPQAQGVLPVCLGSGTKLSELFLNADKQYRAVLRLGITTDTQDMTGKVLRESESIPDADAMRRVIDSFVGQIRQIPPMYSAIKHQGKKLYQLARKGVEIEREPRKVTIRAIDVEQIDADRITMRITCSKGTYIRTLCADIGEKAGCGGCMESLVRTRSGPFGIESALTTGRIGEKLAQFSETEEDAAKRSAFLSSLIIPPDRFFYAFPGYATVPEDDYLLWNGNPLLIGDMTVHEDPSGKSAGDVPGDVPGTMMTDIPDTVPAQIPDTMITLPEEVRRDSIRMYDSKGQFWGLYVRANRKGLYKPWKMFPPM